MKLAVKSSIISEPTVHRSLFCKLLHCIRKQFRIFPGSLSAHSSLVAKGDKILIAYYNHFLKNLRNVVNVDV